MCESKSTSLFSNSQWTRKEITMTALKATAGITLIALTVFAVTHMIQHNMYATPGHWDYVRQSNFWGSWSQPVWIPYHVNLAPLLGSLSGQSIGCLMGGILLAEVSFDISDKIREKRIREKHIPMTSVLELQDQ